MKVLYTHRTQGRGAEGSHILGMVEAFRDLGHDVRVDCLPGCDPSLPIADAPNSKSEYSFLRRIYRSISLYAPQIMFEILEVAYNIPLFFRFLARSRKEQPELIYERYALNTFAPVWVARLLGIPHILEVNDSITVERSRPLMLKRLAAQIERFCMGRTSLVITISQRFENQLRDRFDLSTRRILVCPNAVSERRFLMRSKIAAHSLSRLRSQLGIKNRFVVGSAGQFVPWHGLTTCIETIAPLVKDLDIYLLFIGDGPVREEVLATAKQHGIDDRIQFTGMIPLSDVPDYLDLLDVGIIPFSNIHGSPMKLMEFMAVGLPVLVPDLPPIREVIEDGITGRTFPAGNMQAMSDCLRELLEQPKLRETLAMRAREYVGANLTWRVHALRILEHLGLPKTSSS